MSPVRRVQHDATSRLSTFDSRPQGENGDEGNRTPDLCSAIAALSHLSYIPGNRPAEKAARHMVDQGLEPRTSRM
jgi:hypothetical protein